MAETTVPVLPRRSQIDYFWSKVDKNGPIPPHQPDLGPCWLWRGTRDRDGYGVVKFDKRQWRAPRFIYELHNGPLPSELVVRHRCDNRPCVRLSHLVDGTPADNAADAMERGRLSRGDAHWSRVNADLVRGVNNPAAKLDESQVRRIRAEYAVPHQLRPRQVDLAEAYGVTQGLVSAIIRRAVWTHLDD